MSIYLYTARDIFTQKKVKGEIEGENEADIRQILMDKNLYPEKIRIKNILNQDIKFFPSKIRLIDITFFCKQFGAMIEAGISVARSLELCATQTSNPKLSRHLLHVLEKIKSGEAFYKAMEHEKIFPNLLVQLIMCGENSGNLGEVIKRASEYLDNQLNMQKKIKKALTYPMFVMGLMIIVVIILMIKVVPSYKVLLIDTGASMPLPTQVLIKLSELLSSWWPMILIMLSLMSYFFLNIKRIPWIKRYYDWMRLKLPFVGRLIKQSLSATFSNTMAMLIQAGIPILQAMEMTRKVMTNAIAEEEINKAIKSLKKGNTLSNALKDSRIYPPILLSMVYIGEESGTLDEMLIKMSDYFKGEVEVTTERLTALIEPIMIIMITMMIGGIMAAIVLPTFAAATAVM